MPASGNLYRKAQEIKDTLYPKLRTVSMVDTLMPDDYNVPYQIMKALLEAVGKTSPIPHREIKMKDDVYGEHVSDLRTICYELWLYIYQKLLDPYTTDPEFFELKNILDSMRLPKHGDELKPDEWNSISNYCRRMVDLILRYPTGFFEPWNDWSHINENWCLDFLGYLDTSTYVSPPSSLTARPVEETEEPEMVTPELINPDYVNVPYVQIETWAKTQGDWGSKGGALGFYFRSYPFDYFPYTFDMQEEWSDDTLVWRYEILFRHSPYVIFFDTFQNKCKAYVVRVYWYEPPILIGEQTLVNKPAHANEWNKYRATLRKSGSGVNISLEYWDGNQWRIMGSFNHDSDIIWGEPYYHGISIAVSYWENGEYKDVRTWIDDTLVIKL